MPKTKYYAVRAGRQGPMIYNSWDECKANVSRYPGAIHKSFSSHEDAQQWLNAYTSVRVSQRLVHKEESDSEIEFLSGPSYCPHKPADSESDIEFIEGPSVPRIPQHTSTYLDDEIEILSGPPATAQKETPTVDPPKIFLSPEQTAVLYKVKNRQNVFFTGSAGTGKSVLLGEIIQALGGRASETLAITASTGIASVNIGGTTLHSWAGIGLGDETTKKLVGKFLGQPKFEKVLKRWRTVKTLIIDEISMLDGVLFDKLEEVARTLRGNERCFGGIQLVLSGDFCQLPPVPGREDGKQIPSTFAFDARSWNKCVGSPITLTKVFRQKDQDFVDMLNAMRFGELDAATINTFKKLSRKVVYNDMIEPTELYSTRAEVEGANKNRLNKLPGSAFTYLATDMPGTDATTNTRISTDKMGKLLERLVVPDSITLKVNAQVMLVKNIEQGRLVNGSVGTVVGFDTTVNAIANKTAIGRVESGQAIAEVQDPKIQRLPADRQWPLVRFTSGRTILCIPHEFTVNNSSGEMEAQRNQIPLILAWALSVHKSQGQTLERVRVDLRRTFEKGQAYVALSRATKMETLEVLNFDPSKVTAHPRVIAWHRAHNGHSNGGFDDDDDDDDDDEMEMYF